MKYTAVRSTYFCLIFFWISAGMSAAQEQQNQFRTTTAAIAELRCQWKGRYPPEPGGPLPSNPLRGEQLPPGTILDTGSGRLLLRLSDAVR